MKNMMDIGGAVSAMKNGHRVARIGWNGRGMWICYHPGYPGGVPIGTTEATATGLELGTVCRILPYILMYTADRALVPWLASQTDLLAEDWVEV